ncbi:MAG TPA: carbohydrate-binding family V/XII [Burkholderiales bacterium]|nr:carbohydrate-binding family V/XII [Burkholderiales bacterium]
MIRLLAAAAALAAACLAAAQAPAPAPDVAWPRQAKGADGTVVMVYQPQIESWAENQLTARAAVAVTRPGEQEPRYGVIELAARTDIDKAADVATLSALRITKSSFPGATEAETKQYLATLRGAVKRTSWPVSVQALQANLAITQARSKQKAQPVKNEPPAIVFRTTPSLLVLIDGEPALRPVKDAPSLQRVINTRALILQDTPSSAYYLWALGRWRAAKSVTGEWQAAEAPPASLESARAAMKDQYDPLDGKDADGKPLFDPAVTPQIIVATKPTELLQSKGEPQMSPIPGTQLLYMANSPNDILFDLVGQSYYILVSGRWFNAKSMNGPWSFVPGKNLPADFAKIPPDHAMGDLLAAVPGTSQAREAAIANDIPQTATVQRDVQPTAVVFDGGEPQWKPIDGTALSYAPNTQAPVIRVDPKSYYMVQNGVWFTAAVPKGPWSVAATVPAVIYSIPPSSPVHYVTYVRVYSSTPTTVFVGYTPGYYGTVMSTDGVVVYGTGYYYPAYIGTYWYPYPPTYGYGVGFTVGFFWGVAIGGGWYRPCCYGGGVYVSHHTNINIDNSYNRWGNRAQAGQLPANRNVQSKQVGNTTFAKGAGDNVYAGRDGNVYRRNDSGDWQKYDGKGNGWSDVGGDRGDRGQGARPDQSLPGGDRGSQPRASNQLPGETRGSLDRQAQARDVGNQRAQNYRSGGGYGGGGYGGGGRAGGGFGGGGGRGGGRR